MWCLFTIICTNIVWIIASSRVQETLLASAFLSLVLVSTCVVANLYMEMYISHQRTADDADQSVTLSLSGYWFNVLSSWILEMPTSPSTITSEGTLEFEDAQGIDYSGFDWSGPTSYIRMSTYMSNTWPIIIIKCSSWWVHVEFVGGCCYRCNSGLIALCRMESSHSPLLHYIHILNK